MNMVGPEVLVNGIRCGEETAFRLFFNNYHQALFRFCARYRDLDRDQVIDIVQQTFVNVIEHIDELKDPRKLRTWVFMIARNQVVSLLRKKATERAALAEIRSQPQEGDDWYFLEQRLAAVEIAVCEVADEITKKIAAQYYGDERRTTQSIADELGIPKGTVTVKLQRLRQRVHRLLIRKVLDHELPEDLFRELHSASGRGEVG